MRHLVSIVRDGALYAGSVIGGTPLAGIVRALLQGADRFPELVVRHLSIVRDVFHVTQCARRPEARQAHRDHEHDQTVTDPDVMFSRTKLDRLRAANSRK